MEVSAFILILSRMDSWESCRGLVKDSYLGRSRCPIVNGYFNIMISNGSLVLSMHKLCGRKVKDVSGAYRQVGCGVLMWRDTTWDTTWLSTACCERSAPSLHTLVLKNPRSCFVFFQPSSLCYNPQTWHNGRHDLICVVLKAVLRYSKVCINSNKLLLRFQ